MFDVVWSGRRHVMMGASQIDPFGNQNFAFIGDVGEAEGAAARHARRARQHDQPHHELLGPEPLARACSCPKVDVVSGVGYDRAAELGEWVKAHHEIRRVVTNLAVLDFATPDHRMRLVSVHPGVTVDEVVAATGFELAVDDDVPETRLPTDEELAVIATCSTRRARASRRCRADAPADSTPASAICSASTCRSCRPAWAGSPGPRLVSATAEAGGLGILASATMDFRPAAERDRRGEDAHDSARSA